MITGLLCGLALAGPWADANADIEVERTLDRSRAEVFADLIDLERVREAAPDSCLEEWALGTPTQGVGANGKVTYHFGLMRRRLTITVDRADQEQVVRWDHPEKRGFTTQLVLSDTPEGGTVVALGTYINSPPWPFKPYYFKKIQPEWAACYESLLANLDG